MDSPAPDPASGAAARRLITFDFDGVLCRPPFGINPGKGMNKRRDAPGTKGPLWRTERWRYLGRKPMPGAAEGFRLLATEYDTAIVSARSGVATGLTTRWLQRHIGIVPPLNLRPHWRETSAQFKVRVLSVLQPLAHFEDDPHTARWLAELLPAVFLVDWPRNRWLEAPNIHRIASLSEALPILRSLTP